MYFFALLFYFFCILFGARNENIPLMKGNNPIGAYRDLASITRISRNFKNKIQARISEEKNYTRLTRKKNHA
jgi:hypothetical protein